MTTQDGYDWPNGVGDERWPREVVTIAKRPGATFLYQLQPGDTWKALPDGSIIVANPQRRPMRCLMRDGHYVQEVLEV